MRRTLPGLIVLLLAGCGGAGYDASPRPAAAQSPVELRAPTAAESRGIAAVAADRYRYTSSLRAHGKPPPPPSHLRTAVVRARVTRGSPAFAAAVVELRDPRGERQPGTLALVMRKVYGRYERSLVGPWELVGATAASFTRACEPVTPRAIRALVCPDPWSVLGYPRPEIRLDMTDGAPLRSDDLREVGWKRVTLPGAACGGERPIPLRRGRGWARSALEPWWPEVDVALLGRSYGDLDGDGRDEAAIGVVCGNGGGTGAGQLAFTSVVFAAREGRLRVVGIVRPQQPLGVRAVHVPILGRVKLEPGRITAREAWYSEIDGTCCPSGRARTTWTYAGGELRPERTEVIRAPKRPRRG